MTKEITKLEDIKNFNKRDAATVLYLVKRGILKLEVNARD